MPPNVRRAHQGLERAVDRLYRRKRLMSERERVEYLFMLYERMRAQLTPSCRLGGPTRMRGGRAVGWQPSTHVGITVGILQSVDHLTRVLTRVYRVYSTPTLGTTPVRRPLVRRPPGRQPRLPLQPR